METKSLVSTDKTQKRVADTSRTANMEGGSFIKRLEVKHRNKNKNKRRKNSPFNSKHKCLRIQVFRSTWRYHQWPH